MSMARNSCRPATLLRIALLSGASLLAVPAFAQSPPSGTDGVLVNDVKKTGVRDDSIGVSTPWLDPFGHRAFLAARGIRYELNYVFDVLGNTTGGRRRGTVYSGRTEGALELDERFFGWEGISARANVFHIHGAALSRSYIGNIAPVSNIEAFPAVRLFEAWVQQRIGIFSLRVGQLGADGETAVSSTAGQFNNGSFGWPAFNAANLPSGGPAYPLATPGATLQVAIGEPFKVPLSIRFGAFNGDPARAGSEDPQRRNRNGLDFRLRGGGLFATEMAYEFDKDGKTPGVYKIGGWYHSGRFDDRRFGNDGLSLADAASSGTPLRHRGNHGIYGIIDQTLIPANDAGLGALNVFARAFYAPLADRNFLRYQIDGGAVIKGLFGRAGDSAGIAVAYMQLSNGQRQFDRDFADFNPGTPVRSREVAIEANYLFEVRKGFTLQPSIQYIIRPAGGVLNPLSATPQIVKNATVFGLRGVVKY